MCDQGGMSGKNRRAWEAAISMMVLSTATQTPSSITVSFPFCLPSLAAAARRARHFSPAAAQTQPKCGTSRRKEGARYVLHSLCKVLMANAPPPPPQLLAQGRRQLHQPARVFPAQWLPNCRFGWEGFAMRGISTRVFTHFLGSCAILRWHTQGWAKSSIRSGLSGNKQGRIFTVCSDRPQSSALAATTTNRIPGRSRTMTRRPTSPVSTTTLAPVPGLTRAGALGLFRLQYPSSAPSVSPNPRFRSVSGVEDSDLPDGYLAVCLGLSASRSSFFDVI